VIYNKQNIDIVLFWFFFAPRFHVIVWENIKFGNIVIFTN